MKPKTSTKKSNFSILIAIIGILLLASAFFLIEKKSPLSENKAINPLTQSVWAKEVYDLFQCPCCSQPIGELCCEMAKERKAYIDGLIEGGLTKEEVISAYVKKYGINSFIKEEDKDEYRKKLIQQAPANRPIISLSPESYNFGNVSQKQGVVTYSFKLKNQGTENLIINKIETSCGCTSASIIYQGKEGPIFNMPGHGINEKIKDWQVVIPPQGTAQLKVYYNPNVHPNFRGFAIRTISVFSNDPVDFEKEVQIELNQVD